MKPENFFNKMDSIDAENYKSLLNNFNCFVKARDPFMSGWGEAPNHSYVIVLCEDKYDAMAVMDGLEKSNMKNINYFYIDDLKSLSKRSGDHYSLYVCFNTKWWKDNIWQYSMKKDAKEPSRATRYQSTGILRCHKTKVPAKKSKKLVCPEKMF